MGLIRVTIPIDVWSKSLHLTVSKITSLSSRESPCQLSSRHVQLIFETYRKNSVVFHRDLQLALSRYVALNRHAVNGCPTALEEERWHNILDGCCWHTRER